MKEFDVYSELKPVDKQMVKDRKRMSGKKN